MAALAAALQRVRTVPTPDEKADVSISLKSTMKEFKLTSFPLALRNRAYGIIFARFNFAGL